MRERAKGGRGEIRKVQFISGHDDRRIYTLSRAHSRLVRLLIRRLRGSNREKRDRQSPTHAEDLIFAVKKAVNTKLSGHETRKNLRFPPPWLLGILSCLSILLFLFRPQFGPITQSGREKEERVASPPPLTISVCSPPSYPVMPRACLSVHLVEMYCRSTEDAQPLLFYTGHPQSCPNMDLLPPFITTTIYSHCLFGPLP